MWNGKPLFSCKRLFNNGLDVIDVTGYTLYINRAIYFAKTIFVREFEKIPVIYDELDDYTDSPELYFYSLGCGTIA